MDYGSSSGDGSSSRSGRLRTGDERLIASPQTYVAIEALSSELRATEVALAHWRAHAGRLHAQVRALRRAPDDTIGAPRSMLPLSHVPLPQRARGDSISSLTSFASTSTFRGHGRVRASATSPPAAGSPAAILETLQTSLQHMLNPREAELAARREHGATRLQSCWRGARQRRHFAAARAFYAIVNGVVELTSAGRTVPAYIITVVRGGQCWQVSHRFSDWIELDKQLATRLPAGCSRPSLPSRVPFRSARVTSYRQYALNAYLQAMLPLVSYEYGGPPGARRLLLHFLSRSHVHWLYAGDQPVPFTPPTHAVCVNQRAELARSVGGARAAVNGSPFASGGRGAAAWHTAYDPFSADGDVRDASSGVTPLSAVVSAGPGRRSPLPRN
jgi:hypothetical protein